MQTPNYDAARRGMSHTSPSDTYAMRMVDVKERERVPFYASSCPSILPTFIRMPFKERVAFNNLNYLRMLRHLARSLTIRCSRHPQFGGGKPNIYVPQ